MSYKKSKARVNFEHDLKKILITVKITYSNKCTISETRSFVLCSAILLTSAKIENYLQEVVNDWASLVAHRSLKVGSLPKNLRSFMLVNNGTTQSAYKHYFAFGDEGKLIDSITNTLDNQCYQWVSSAEPLSGVNTSIVLSGKKYPSPRNIEVLFNRLGLGEIFNELNRAAKSDLQSDLTSFNDLRTTIAHEGIPIGLNDYDIKNKLNHMKRFVAHLDRIFFKHVVKHTGAATWK